MVLMAEKLGTAGLALLWEFANVNFSYDLSPEGLRAKISLYDALVVRSGTNVGRDVFEASGGRLRIVGRGRQIEDVERTRGVEPDTLTVDGVPIDNYLTRSPSLCLRRGVVASDYTEVYASMAGNSRRHVVEQRSVKVNWIIKVVWITITKPLVAASASLLPGAAPQVVVSYQEPTSPKEGHVYKVFIHIDVVEDLRGLAAAPGPGGAMPLMHSTKLGWRSGAPDGTTSPPVDRGEVQRHEGDAREVLHQSHAAGCRPVPPALRRDDGGEGGGGDGRRCDGSRRPLRTTTALLPPPMCMDVTEAMTRRLTDVSGALVANTPLLPAKAGVCVGWGTLHVCIACR
ncbi:hypothetical protein ZWY2020_046807 [Hordeum vulgare]|nr:hypothetical protein ZWY2020_046807 [Hordeum vulgare]